MDLTQTRYEVAGGIATVTLNRPEHLNAFTSTMRRELVEIFGDADRDDEVRAVVVTGSGKTFCAGADLSSGGSTFEMCRWDDKEVSISERRDGGGTVALAVYQCRKPVIGAINGHAVGVGITMTLPMDMRIAEADAKMGFVFTRRGVVPEACSSWFLPRIVPTKVPTEIGLTDLRWGGLEGRCVSPPNPGAICALLTNLRGEATES